MTTNDQREAKPKAPKATVATEPEPTSEPDAQDAAGAAKASDAAAKAATDDREAAEAAADTAKGLAQGIGDWLASTFPGHVNAVVFGFVGLLAALLLFSLGLWQTLLIAVLVACGVAFGQYLDGDPRIIRFVGRLFDNGTHKRKK